MSLYVIIGGAICLELLLLFAGAHPVTAVPAMALGVAACLFGRDLRDAKELIRGCRVRRHKGGAPAVLRAAATGLGAKLISEVHRLQQEISLLDWNVKTEALEQEHPLAELMVCEELDPKNLTHGVDERRFYLRLLKEIPRYFRADEVAIVRAAADPKRPELISLHRLERAQGLIQLFASEVFSEGFQSPLGCFDTALFAGPLASLGKLGFQSVVALRFSFESSDRLLWLGYRGFVPPAPMEVARAERLVKRVAAELASSRALIEMTREVERVRGLVKRKSEFVAHLSHDLRSPLNNIAAILRLFKLRGSDESEGGELVEAAIANCEAIDELMSDILDYSRHQAGALSAQKSWVDGRKLLEEMEETYRVAARMKGLTLRLELPAERAVQLHVDKKQVRRILANLIGNALKYTLHGEIVVRLSEVDANCIAVDVCDTGVGMTREQLERVFAPFSRFAVELADGVGLGLSLSRIFAELNGGELLASSEKGVGTSLTLHVEGRASVLPAAGTENVPPQTISAIPEPANQESALHVLLVDDDIDCVQSLARSLELRGMRVTQTYTTPDALSVVNFCPPDVIVSDGKMPCGGGESILHFLRRRRLSVPLIILSGEASDAVGTKLISLGASEVLLKPASIDEVVQSVERPVKGLSEAASA